VGFTRCPREKNHYACEHPELNICYCDKLYGFIVIRRRQIIVFWWLFWVIQRYRNMVTDTENVRKLAEDLEKQELDVSFCTESVYWYM